MSSSLEDHAEGKIRFYGMQIGVVTDNKDPEGKHRVRVQVPGICEPATDWAWPATIGGGGPQRGGHVVPSEGSTVLLWFHQGDPQGSCAYLCAWWGEPDEGSEMPNDALADEANAEQVQSLEIDNLRITIDERPGKRSFKVVDVDPATGKINATIAIDREKKGIVVSAMSAIIIKTPGLIHLDATVIRIGDRVVATSSKPI